MNTAKAEAALEEILIICQSAPLHSQPSLSVFADLLEQIEAIAQEATGEQS